MRLLELRFTTPYLDGETYVRVLLPRNYGRRNVRSPSLYLLEGANNPPPQARDWTTPATKGKAEEITAASPFIVVMPDAGKGGWYTDWYNDGVEGNPRWESYIIRQLVPWIDDHFQTVGARWGRAIAGPSMGGFGAMSLAARHPDLFAAAASFSGVLNTNDPPMSAAVDALALMDRTTPFQVFGPRVTEEVHWRAHNPLDLASNLRGLHLAFYSGNGVPPASEIALLGEQEVLSPGQATAMHDRLDAYGIPSSLRIYNSGGHTWPTFNRSFAEELPRLEVAVGKPTGGPSSFNFTAVEPNFEAYGYIVRMHRTVAEFASLGAVTTRGFTLSGSGRADIITAPRYSPGGRYLITATTPGRRLQSVVNADELGRLHIPVLLGPSNTVQQYTTNSQASRRSYEASVLIIRSSRRSSR